LQFFTNKFRHNKKVNQHLPKKLSWIWIFIGKPWCAAADKLTFSVSISHRTERLELHVKLKGKTQNTWAHLTDLLTQSRKKFLVRLAERISKFIQSLNRFLSTPQDDLSWFSLIFHPRLFSLGKTCHDPYL
jgi:hypothetical protein